MVFSIILRVEDHPGLANLSTDDVSTELTYSPGMQLVDTQTITVTEYMYTTYTFTNQTVPDQLLFSIIIIHAEIKVILSQKCCRGTVQTAMSHITCLQLQQHFYISYIVT